MKRKVFLMGLAIMILLTGCGANTSSSVDQQDSGLSGASSSMVESDVLSPDLLDALESFIKNDISPYDWSVEISVSNGAVDYVLYNHGSITPDWTFADVVFLATEGIRHQMEEYQFPLGSVTIKANYVEDENPYVKRWTTTDLENGEFFSLPGETEKLTLDELAERCNYQSLSDAGES